MNSYVNTTVNKTTEGDVWCPQCNQNQYFINAESHEPVSRLNTVEGQDYVCPVCKLFFTIRTVKR